MIYNMFGGTLNLAQSINYYIYNYYYYYCNTGEQKPAV